MLFMRSWYKSVLPVAWIIAVVFDTSQALKMSLTEQQKAYHLRKVRTRFVRLDVNKDGYISREDYELMAKQIAELSTMTTEKQAKEIHEAFMKVADAGNLKPGEKYPEEHMQQASQLLLSKPKDEQTALIEGSHNPLFDAVDTNNDGFISTKEFQVYMKVLAPALSEEEAAHSFDTIDANKDGKISREEFLSAAVEFFFGVEESEVSNAFMGKLVD